MRLAIPLLACAAAALSGCDRGYRTRHIDDEVPAANVWMVRTMSDEAVENAVVAQRTIYPYHFVRDSAELTPVGERDVRVLAAHFRDHPGSLNVRRGDGADGLFDARTRSVAEALARHGVEPSSIRLTDNLPGGDGVSSDRAIEILKAGTRMGGGGYAGGGEAGGSGGGSMNGGSEQ